MHRNVLILLAGLLAGYIGFSQQNNVWYFGTKAGLDFNGAGQPIPAVLNNSAMTTSEGCSSICGSDGKLLFYSNGVTVYNRQHRVMLNGDGLLGNMSSVQACIIVPVPGNDSLFYLFATDAFENSFANGYTYSIINIKRDNGNGEVVSKNNMLWPSCSERMLAVRHANGTDVWLITNDNNSNTFRAWLINCGGLQPGPVISNSGLVLDQHDLTNNGMLKASPDARQLCQTHFPESDIVIGTANFIQLFDFDNATGIISNPKTVSFAGARIVSCEYSPDSKLLYLTNHDVGTIEQLEPTLPTAADIAASRITINTGGSSFYGIQLAPDGKIYLAKAFADLAVINRPDIKGSACNFTGNKISLAPGSAYLSLPAYINDFSSNPNNGFSYTILDSCTGRVQFNGLTTMSGTITWQWDFGDGNTATGQNPIHTFPVAGQLYMVKVKISSTSGCGYIERSKQLIPGGLGITAAFDIESKCDSGYVRFINRSVIIPDTATVTYRWTFGDGNTSAAFSPVHTYAAAGVYNATLDIITSTSCLNRSATHPVNLQLLNIQALATNTEIDAGQTVQLSATGGGSTFVWTPATWLSDDSIPNPIATPGNNITYKVVAKNDAGCSDSAYISIKVLPLPGIYMPTGFSPDNDGLNDLIRPIITKEFTLQHFIIYNRWGQKVFETAQKGIGWNGKLNGVPQDTGVYAWVINATDTRNNKKHDLKGTFIIIRK